MSQIGLIGKAHLPEIPYSNYLFIGAEYFDQKKKWKTKIMIELGMKIIKRTFCAS